MIKRIGLLTSGGDCQALNAAMRGVVKTLANGKEEVEIYGFLDGYRGLIYGNFRMLTDKDFSGILTKGGTILGTSRPPFKTIQDPDPNGLNKVEAMKQNYYKLQLDCLVILGGNRTHKTANLLRKEGLNIVTLPKTIDNDLFGTDHCPGFASAAKYIATSCMEIYQDARVYDTGMVCVVEIMGRHAGWLAGAAGLATAMGAGPDLVYLPETDFDMKKFLADVKRIYDEKGNCLVAVSEGIHYADGSFVSEAKTSATDGFGHAQLGGLASMLADTVKNELGCKVRGIELSLLQRCAAHCASKTDVDESYMSGKAAVENAVAGKTDYMPGFKCTRDENGYKCEIELLPLSEVANTEKKVPREWINEEGNGVTQEFVDYALPLINGEIVGPKVSGLPRFANLKKIKAEA